MRFVLGLVSDLSCTNNNLKRAGCKFDELLNPGLNWAWQHLIDAKNEQVCHTNIFAKVIF